MTRVFLSTWGQHDNIGDSILRRGLLRSFQGIVGVETHLHTGLREPGEPNGEDYLSALGLRGDEVRYERSIDWLRAAAVSVFATRIVLVLPAGEIAYADLAQRMSPAGNLVLAYAPRVRGGTAVQVGAGVKLTPRRARRRSSDDTVRVPYLEQVSRRGMAMVAWRDPATKAAFGVGDVLPDWAFGEGPDPTAGGLGDAPAQRTVIAVTTRYDRGVLNQDKIEFLRRLAQRHGLSLQVYSQVRRDDEHSAAMGRLLHPGTEAILFGDQTHAECEQRVRALHRKSAIVASDRAHALVIGATEGAIPLAVSNESAEKPVRILRAAGLAAPDSDASVDTVESYLRAQLADPQSIERPIIAARAQIAVARTRLRAIAAFSH